jgi:hypothetical protein
LLVKPMTMKASPTSAKQSSDDDFLIINEKDVLCITGRYALAAPNAVVSPSVSPNVSRTPEIRGILRETQRNSAHQQSRAVEPKTALQSQTRPTTRMALIIRQTQVRILASPVESPANAGFHCTGD